MLPEVAIPWHVAATVVLVATGFACMVNSTVAIGVVQPSLSIA